MKKKSFFSRLQVQIILACGSVLLIALFAIGSFSIRQYRELLQENSKKHAIDISSAVEAALDTCIDGYGEFSRNAYLSEEVHTMLDDSIPAILRQTAFQEYCNSSVGYRRYLNAIYLISENGTVLVNKGYTRQLPNALESYDWYRRLLAAEGGVVIDYGKSWLNDAYPTRENTVTVGRLMKSLKVENTTTYYTPTGAIVFELSPAFMDSLIKFHDLSGTELVLTDETDCIIFDSTGNPGGTLLCECYPEIRDDLNYELTGLLDTSDLYVQKENLKYGWKLYLLFDLSEDTAKASVFLRYILVLTIALLLIALLLSSLFSRNIVKPIEKIRNNMKKIEDGHLNERLTDDFPYELEGIARSYNHMLDSLQDQINENYVMKLETLDSKYKALEAQINPHFIFNVLDMINSELILSGNTASAKTIRSLAKLIRYNLENTRDMITLDEDRKYIETYCSLLQEVYPDFTRLSIDLPEDLKEHPIPSHCIQPLVENAVRHGFQGAGRPGILEIRVLKKDGFLQISIRDNGNGIPAEKLAELTARFTSSETESVATRSIGLLNVHRRLRMKFGPAYGLHMISAPGAFTEVTILLPE